jgi:hypothetical protein
MNNVVDGYGTILDTLLGLLRRRISTYNSESAADLRFL